MKPPNASAFPELRRVFSGYLHEDFGDEHGSPEGALAAFYADANDAERRRFQQEARRFLTATAPLEFAQVQMLMERLGSRWMPPTRAALENWLESRDSVE